MTTPMFSSEAAQVFSTVLSCTALRWPVLGDDEPGCTATQDAVTCQCNGELCNQDWETAGSTTSPSPAPSPTQPPGGNCDQRCCLFCLVEGLTCYNCGYRMTPDGMFEALPDLPFCEDFTTTQDNTVQCADPDCCGSIKAPH